MLQGVEARFGEGARAIVLALSNPDSLAECTAREAFDWSGGRAAYASGTTFPPFERPDGSQYVPSQANNSLVFPGMLCLLRRSTPSAPSLSFAEKVVSAGHVSEQLTS